MLQGQGKGRQVNRRRSVSYTVSCMAIGPALVFAQPDAASTGTVLPEVEVRASASDAQEIRRNSSAGKIVVSREELEALDASSVAELLSRLPGVGMFADPSSGPRGRGPNRNMPQILVDGQALPGGGRNSASALRLPVELIERVEIIRNSTAEFPVLGSGGVVNLILRDVPSKPIRNAKVGLGTLSGEPTVRLEGQYGEPDKGDFGYLLSGAISSRSNVGTNSRESVNYTAGVPSGFLNENTRNTGQDTNVTLSPRFSWNLGDGQKLNVSPFVTLTANNRDSQLSRNQNGVLSRDWNTDEGQRASGRLSTEWKSTRPGGTETSAKLMLQAEYDSLDRDLRRFDAGGALTSQTNEKTTSREQQWLVELRRKQLFFDSHLLTGAIEIKDSNNDDTQNRSGSVVSSDVARLSEQRKVMWLQDEWQMGEKHVLTPGLRWQKLDTRIDDSQTGVISRSDNTLDPSLHYLYQYSSEWNFRASVADNTKSANMRDLSPFTRTTTGINSSSNPDRGGNPDLRPEKLRSIELGVEHFLPKRAGTIGLSVFRRDIDDYIQRLVQEDTATGRWVEKPYNVGNAEQTGVLLDFKTTMGVIDLPQLTLRGNTAYTDVKMLETVPGLGPGEGPRKSVNLGMDYDIRSMRLTLGGNFNYVSALDKESSAVVKQTQGARRQLDLYALYKLDSQMALRFSAQNLTREMRYNYLEESDAAGNVVRRETDRTPGLAMYMVTLEMKF